MRPWHVPLGWRRVLLVLAAVALASFIVLSAAAHDALLQLLEALEHASAGHRARAATLVVLFTALAASVAFVSSWLVVPFAVYTWGPGGALLLVWTGWVLGGAVSYALGRRLGPSVARWLGFGPLLTRYQDQVSSRTPFTLALLVQLALPSEMRGYLFGLGRYPFGRYLLSLGLAELPFGIATIYLGAGVLQRRLAPVLALAAGLVLLSAASWYALHRRLAASHSPGPRAPAS
jgi:uncharacterized membrane protein YdjX (TVP38/TMEM64 family)